MTRNHVVSHTAIYLLAIVMIVFAIKHFIDPHDMIVYVPGFLPGGIIWVYVVGLAFLLVGLAFLSNRYVKLASYLLAAILLIFILTVHLPNSINAASEEYRRIAFINLLKDAAIMGFALHIAASARNQRLHFQGDD